MAGKQTEVVKAVVNCFILLADVVSSDIDYPGGESIPGWIEGVENVAEVLDKVVDEEGAFDNLDVDIEDMEDTVAAVVDAIIELQEMIDKVKS